MREIDIPTAWRALPAAALWKKLEAKVARRSE
jgi:hypothetical protein